MSWVSEIRDICGDYAIDIKYFEGQEQAITLYFNSRRNAETVKRCIVLDDSVPNVATAVDFVEVVRCKDCKYCIEHHYEEEGEKPYIKLSCKWSEYSHQPDDYCSYGERRERNEG